MDHNNSQNGSQQCKFSGRIKQTKQALKTWNKNCFKQVDNQVHEQLNKIDKIQQEDPAIENSSAEIDLQAELH